jgi:hypothetical protein
MSHESNIQELLDTAAGLPYGAAKVATLEEAIRHADAANDAQLGFEARHELLDAAVMSGRADLLLVHYPWCLAQFDKTPQHFDEYDLLWRYKWVMGNLAEFPEIPLAQIERLLDDMDERFRNYGASGRTVIGYRLSLAKHVGDTDRAAELFHEYRKAPRDALSNCAACEANAIVSYHLFAGQNRLAVDAAKDIVSGRLSCRTVPGSTYAMLLLPRLKLGELELAADHHRAGYRLLLKSAEPVSLAPYHMQFLGLTGNFTLGVRLLTKHLGAAMEGFEPQNQFWFYRGAWLLLECLTQAEVSPRIRLPEKHPLAKKTATVADLQAWCHAEASQLAARFDTRNGTSSFRSSLANVAKLLKHATDHAI